MVLTATGTGMKSTALTIPVNKVALSPFVAVENPPMILDRWIVSPGTDVYKRQNMEWSPNNGIQNQQQEIEAANHPNIRFFSISKQGSKCLQEDCHAQWEKCMPTTMQQRSAVAYFFGKQLQKKLNVDVYKRQVPVLHRFIVLPKYC